MKLKDNQEKMYEDPRMYDDEKNHFGMYYGGVMYSFIRDNDLWDLEYPILKELTYTIRTMIKYHRDGITDDYFRSNPKEYYIDRFELKSFTVESLLKLWEATENLIEFKERLKADWPYL